MGFGMQRGAAANANIKRDHHVTQFVDAAGLTQVAGLTEYLLSLPVDDLASLDDGSWNSILNQVFAGQPHDPAMNKRIQAAISDLRVKYKKDQEEQAELAELRHLINGGAHPKRQEAREAAAAAARPPVDINKAAFIGVPYFQGDMEGFEFRDGSEGLGYYRMQQPATSKVWTRYPNGPPGSGSVATGSAATGPTKRPTGFNPVEQQANERQHLQQQRLARQQHAEQAMMLDRMHHGHLQPGSAMLLRSSPE